MAKKLSKEQENIERIKSSKLWSKHWAEQGLPVIHHDQLNYIGNGKKYEDIQMRVDHICQEIVGLEKKKYTTGIKCRWYQNEEGKSVMKESIFNSKELIPVAIANLGMVVVGEWYERFNFNGQ